MPIVSPPAEAIGLHVSPTPQQETDGISPPSDGSWTQLSTPSGQQAPLSYPPKSSVERHVSPLAQQNVSMDGMPVEKSIAWQALLPLAQQMPMETPDSVPVSVQASPLAQQVRLGTLCPDSNPRQASAASSQQTPTDTPRKSSCLHIWPLAQQEGTTPPLGSRPRQAV